MSFSKKLAAIGAAGLMAACGGGGSPGEDAGTSTSAAPAGAFVGTAAIGMPLADTQVLARDASGRSAATTTDAAGRFVLQVGELEAPLMLQVRSEDGVLSSVAVAQPAPGSNIVVNVTPLTNIVVESLANGAADEWWNDPARLDAAKLDPAKVHQAELNLAAAIAPLEAAVGHTPSSYIGEAFDADGRGHDQLLDNLETSITRIDGGGVFAVRQRSAGATPTVWTSSGAAPPAMAIEASSVVSLAGARTAIETGYGAYRSAAATFDPAKVDQPRFQAAVQKIFAASADPSAASIAQVDAWLHEMLFAVGMPASLVEQLDTLMAAGPEALDRIMALVDAFFGEDGPSLRAELANMKVSIVASDPATGRITYRIELGGEVFYETWTTNSQGTFTGAASDHRQHNQCIKSRYIGSGNAAGLSGEQFVRDSEFFNTCSFAVNYASCIWTPDVGAGGHCEGLVAASTAASTTTTLRGVAAGPRMQSRAFVVCAAPAKPSLTGAAGLSSFQARYECRS